MSQDLNFQFILDRYTYRIGTEKEITFVVVVGSNLIIYKFDTKLKIQDTRFKMSLTSYLDTYHISLILNFELIKRKNRNYIKELIFIDLFKNARLQTFYQITIEITGLYDYFNMLKINQIFNFFYFKSFFFL